MRSKLLLRLCVSLLLAGVSQSAAAQSFDFVRGGIPVSPNGFVGNDSQPLTWKSVLRGAAQPDLNRYGFFFQNRWSNWLTEATGVLESADLNFVDITSLTFFETYQRRALLRAIAYNIINKRMDQNFALKAGGPGKLYVRLLFAQNLDGGGVIQNGGFNGSAADPWAGMIAADFIDQFQEAYIDQYGADAWNQNSAGWGNALTDLVEFGVVYAFWGANAIVGGWNHSKIVSNGKLALVGGSNQLTNYLWDGWDPNQNDPIGRGTGVVLDADLLFGGQPAIDASKWVDALFTDYVGVLGNAQLNGVITIRDWNNHEGEPNPCACEKSAANTGKDWCKSPTGPRQGSINGNVLTVPDKQWIIGCYWPGKDVGRLDAIWTGYGAGVAAKWPNMGTPPANAPRVISVGERSNKFGATFNTQEMAAYDTAIGRLMYSADDNIGTRILIAQQDIFNDTGAAALRPDSVDLTAAISTTNTAQRWYLVDRIARELLKPPGQQNLHVYIIKSEQPAYTTYAVYKSISVFWKNVKDRYEYAWTHQAQYNLPVVRSAKPTATRLQDELCRIMQAKRFFNDGQLTRLHSKMVLVASPSQMPALSAVSIGSLNFYNALMMHDYGNIVFDDGSAGTITQTLQAQFWSDWNNSHAPSEWSTLHPNLCETGWRDLFFDH